MQNAGGAHAQLLGLATQAPVLLSGQLHRGQLEGAGLALQVGQAIGQGRFVDVGQLGAEERFVLGLADGQARLGHVVAVRHGRLAGLLAAQVIADFFQHHLHGRVVQGDVVELQGGFEAFGAWLWGLQQADQWGLAQVERAGGFAAIDQHRARHAAPYHLHRLHQAVPEHGGTQDIVARDDLVQGLGEGQQAGVTVECDAPLQQVRVFVCGTQVMVENALLQRCQRVDVLHVGSTTWHRGDDVLEGTGVQRQQRQHGGGDVGAARWNTVLGHADLATFAQRGSQCSHGGLAEQHPHVGLQALLAQAFDQGHSQQRVAAQLEEVVVPPYPFHAQHVGPDAGHGRFSLAGRGFIALADQLGRVRLRQGPTVQLAMAGQRPLVQADERLRHHVPRQAGLQRVTQSLDRHRHLFGEPGQQALATHQYHGIGNTGLGCQRRLDFTQLHAHAADLHLVVIAAEVVQRAIGVPAHQVATAVHARAGLAAERVGEEALFGQFRAIEIAPRYLRAADVQLAHDAHGHRLAMGIEHIDAGIGDGRADVQRRTRQDLARRGDHRGLGRPIVVDQGEAWIAVELAQAVATDQQGAQGRVLPFAAQRLFGHRRGQEADRQRLLEPPVEQFIHMFIADVRRWQVQRGTATQRRPYFPGHGVEAKASNARGTHTGLQREGLAVPVHQVGQGVVFDHHALGLASGAGGVDQVGQVVRIQPRYVRVAVQGIIGGGLVEVQAGYVSWQAGNARFAQHQGGHAVGQQVGYAFGRIARVDRHIGSAGLEHGQQADYSLGAAAHAQCHAVTAAHAACDQLMRQAVGPQVQVTIAECLAILVHGRGIRGLGCSGLHQRVYRLPLRVVLCGGVETAQQLLARFVAQDRQAVDPRILPLLQCLQQLGDGIDHPGGDPRRTNS